LGAPSLPAQAASIVDSNSGIDFRVRLTATPGVVSITWQVSSATLNKGANDFEIQFFVGGGTQWQPQVFSEEPTDNGFPVLIGGVPDLFCFRMVATQNGSGPILGSGTSGNELPCSAEDDPQPTSFTLTVVKVGSGEGTVTSVPAGINCGADCSESYAPLSPFDPDRLLGGTSVTLTAVAAAGSQFAGWSGCSSTSGATCARQMDANRVVTATFSRPVKAMPWLPLLLLDD
jgi:hypothetical protein